MHHECTIVFLHVILINMVFLSLLSKDFHRCDIGLSELGKKQIMS